MKDKKYIAVPIKGMHCRSCEILVEEELKNLKNISSVEVNHKTGNAKIFYDNEVPNKTDIEKSIVKSGYSIGRDDKLS